MKDKFQSDFQRTIEEYLIKFKEERQFLPPYSTKRKWQYGDFTDNIFPPIRHGFIQFAYESGIPFHDFINHVRSSQAFAINLVYPVFKREQGLLIEMLSKKSSFKISEIVNLQFEYSPEKNLLGEWKGEMKPDEYVTAVDICIFGQNKKKEKVAFLFEVKFSEVSFGECNGRVSRANGGEQRKICDSFENLKIEPHKCYLHSPASKSTSPRKYFNYFGNLSEFFSGTWNNAGCPFSDNNQCLRNHSFARALVQKEGFQKAFFGLIYHDGNKKIESEWKKYCELVGPKYKNELFDIKASEIVRSSGDKFFRHYWEDRYKIL